MSFRAIVAILLITSERSGAASGIWDGDTTIYNIHLKPENFLDINSYQFRPSEEIRWYDVENGWRIADGSLETNRAYLSNEMRLKQSITPRFTARLQWFEEEFYEPLSLLPPLLELELQPTASPVSFSLLGAPTYAKAKTELGLAASFGMRPWNYIRVSWLRPDFYYGSKNDIDGSYYRREPSQLTLETAYKWNERYKLRLFWQDNKPLEFVLDNQVSVFAYQNHSYRVSLDYQRNATQTVGFIFRGFDTTQSRNDSGALHSQDIHYYSFNSYWIVGGDGGAEWTLGIRYDDFLNRERTPSVPSTEFNYGLNTAQVYSSYYLPFSPQQAWDLGLYVGEANKQQQYLDPAIASQDNNYFEAKLRTGWNVFSINQSMTLSLALSWNLDSLSKKIFDGGAGRFRTEF